jgi:MoxR-like ATPase
MERGIVTIDGREYPMPSPHMVIATQNPIDYESTFALPDSQLDRFLMSLSLGFPDFESELKILNQPVHHYDQLNIPTVFSVQQLADIQAKIQVSYIDDAVNRFLLTIIHATREDPVFRNGISTRGALALQSAAKAAAFLSGRNYVAPEDIKLVLGPVLSHRLTLQRNIPPEKMRMEVCKELQLIYSRLTPP